MSFGVNTNTGALKINALAVGVPPEAGKKPKKEGHSRWLPPDSLLCLHCGYRYTLNLPAPISIAAAVMKAFSKEHRSCKLDKARGFACTYCFKFGHPYRECPTLDCNGDPAKWLAGPDTGSSSKVIYHCLQNKQVFEEERGFGVFRPPVPHDPGDFGRCYRLLKAIPGWRERIGELNGVPGWKGLVAAWDELEKLYEEELPAGTCPKLYARMQEILATKET